MPLAAAAMTPAVRPTRVAAMALTLAATLAAFLAAAPYTLIDLPTFLNSFARLSSELPGNHRRGCRGVADLPETHPDCAWRARHRARVRRTRPGRGPGGSRPRPAEVGADARLSPALLQVHFRAEHRLRTLSHAADPGAVGARGRVRRRGSVDRVHLVGLPRPARNAVTVALALLAIAPPAYTAVRWDSDRGARTWTQALAYDWVRHNIRPGARITAGRIGHLSSPGRLPHHTSHAVAPRWRQPQPRSGRRLPDRLFAVLRSSTWATPSGSRSSTPTTGRSSIGTRRSRASRPPLRTRDPSSGS